MFICFVIIVLIHIFIAFISLFSFAPNSNKKGKSFSQVQRDEHYAAVFKKNFPFLNSFAWLFLILPIIYYFTYIFFSRIDFDLDSRNILPIIYGAGFSVGFVIMLFFKNIDDFRKRDSEFQSLCPLMGICLTIFIYAVSVLDGFTIVHFLNYSLDFSTGEKHIVKVVDSRHYTTRGSKGGTTHHYKISFTPPVGGHYELDVSPSLQSQANKNDSLELYLKKGFFSMPYIGAYKKIIK